MNTVYFLYLLPRILGNILDTLERLETNQMADRAALDAALAAERVVLDQVVTLVGNLNTSVADLTAKLGAAGSTDFQAEVDAVVADQAALQAVLPTV